MTTDLSPGPARSMVDSQAARAFANLSAAITTIIDAADRAERDISSYSADAGRAAQQVMRGLAWGHANAMSSVETALPAIEDGHVIRRVEAELAQAVKSTTGEP